MFEVDNNNYNKNKNNNNNNDNNDININLDKDSVYELDKDIRITKLQSDIQYLVNILELAKGERVELLSKNEILQKQLTVKESINEEISELRILEEHSFRKNLLKERTLSDQRITIKNNIINNRYNIYNIYFCAFNL
jgi:hypothetical protein